MKRIWVKKSGSFKSAEQFSINYYLLMSPSERLETMQFLREKAFKFKNGSRYGKDERRLQKVIRIIDKNEEMNNSSGRMKNRERECQKVTM